ncbi:MAG TPA: hypothetical protein VFN52_03890 [Acidiferrobacteraceae bacterium]|nr:hypothetical protein [Acidiferrobacteraceae bacterium]
MFILGVGTALPPYRYNQLECLDALEASTAFQRLRVGSQRLLQKVLRNDHGIDQRFLALPDLADVFALAPDVLQQRFAEAAPALSVAAARKALAAAQLAATDIDAVLISTCTGYLCPGLTSYVSETLGLRPNVLGLDLVGQGCGAAIPNLRTADALLGSGHARHVLSVCVEVCSAAFYLDDDPGVLISACLFADGAGAAVLGPRPAAHARTLEWRDSDTVLNADDRDLLRFEHENGMLRNRLSPKVPELAAQYAHHVLQALTGRHQLPHTAVAAWLWHGGGKNVLDSLQHTLQLGEDATALSRSVLRAHGNVSSAFIFFVLEAALRQRAEPGWWWMSTFGAGFSCHGALLHAEAA